MNDIRLKTVLVSLFLLFPAITLAATTSPSTVTLFKNVKVFNGVDEQLYDMDVLVVKNKIHKVAKDIPVSATYKVDTATGLVAEELPSVPGALHTSGTYVIHKADDEGEVQQTEVKVNVIDGGGRTLMPGLIDAHVHLNLQNLDNPAAIDGVSNMTWEEVGALAYDAAQEYLYSGFTTVRDLCGSHDGLRRHIDGGTLIGPRIYLSGACISQTSGHGDWRPNSQVVRKNKTGTSHVEELGIVYLADGYDEVLKACRNNLAGGADFCKMMAGGGVTSMRDPLHSIQGTMDELKAMVKATEQWDSVGAVHAYHDESVSRAVEAGVLSVEHGNLMSEPATFALVKEKGAYVVPAMAGFSEQLLKHPQYGNPDLPLRGKVLQIIENKDNWIKLANETGINLGYGTDVVVSSKLASRGIRDFQMGQFVEGFGNIKTLRYMTSENGKLMALTGKNNPYPEKLGVIEEGAYADIILVDGNPIEDLSVLGASFDMWAVPRADRTIPTIPFVMKDGQVFLNRL